jgi:hypothetical protein
MIQEQDLFNYVFFPGNLENNKTNIIDSDNSFKEIIDFYHTIKNDSGRIIDDHLRKKIAAKIPAYTLSSTVYLKLFKKIKVPKANNSRIAADSKDLIAKMATKTFIDNDKEYLIKVLNYGEITKIFIFSTIKEKITNFDIVIEPQHLIYHFDDNSEPLKVDKIIEVESINLVFY